MDARAADPSKKTPAPNLFGAQLRALDGGVRSPRGISASRSAALAARSGTSRGAAAAAARIIPRRRPRAGRPIRRRAGLLPPRGPPAARARRLPPDSSEALRKRRQPFVAAGAVDHRRAALPLADARLALTSQVTSAARDIPRSPRPGREYYAEAPRGDAAGAARIVRGDDEGTLERKVDGKCQLGVTPPPRPGRGYSAETSDATRRFGAPQVRQRHGPLRVADV